MAKKKAKRTKQPVGPYLKQMNIRVTDEMREKLEAICKAKGFVTYSAAYRYAVHEEAVRCGWRPPTTVG